MRDTFTFYRSFYDSLLELPEKDAIKLVKAICELALNDNEKELTGMSKIIFGLMKPIIKANTKRFNNGKLGAEYGKNGGRKKNPLGVTEENPLGVKTDEQKKTPNVKVNVNDKVKDNVKDKVNVNGEEKELPPFVLEEFFLETFCEHHRKQFNTEYQPEWRNQTDDVAKITDAIVKKMAESNNNLQATEDNFRQFTMKLLQCFYNQADDFQRNHWSLHYIATHFNELYIKILNKKNGNTADKTEYIESLVASLQG